MATLLLWPVGLLQSGFQQALALRASSGNSRTETVVANRPTMTTGRREANKSREGIKRLLKLTFPLQTQWLKLMGLSPSRVGPLLGLIILFDNTACRLLDRNFGTAGCNSKHQIITASLYS
jgi:hypothetical protein